MGSERTLEQVRDQLAAALEGYAGALPMQLRLDGLLLSPTTRQLAGKVLRRYRRSLNAILERQEPRIHVTGYGGGWISIDEAPRCTDCGWERERAEVERSGDDD